jgi:hypothetical protein
MTGPGYRHRGVYAIGDFELSRLLRLPAGQQVVAVSTEWETASVLLLVEGEGLPEVWDGAHPPRLNQYGRIRCLTDTVNTNAAGLPPLAAHALVIGELGAVRFEDPDSVEGRRRILDRHRPRDGWTAYPGCSSCVSETDGDPDEWPCPDYLDAALGLVTGLPGQAEREGELAGAAIAEQLTAGAIMPIAEAVAILSDPATGAKLDALVLGEQAETAAAEPAGEARPLAEEPRRRTRRTPPLERDQPATAGDDQEA